MIEIKQILKKNIVIKIIVLIIFVYNLTGSIYKFYYKYDYSDSISKNFTVTILEVYGLGEDKISYLVKFCGDNFILNIYNNESKNESINEYKYGDIVTFTGKLNIPEQLGNPYEFNYSLYLKSNNICGIFTTNSLKLSLKSVPNIILKIIYKLKEYLNLKINTYLPNKYAELFKTILYGYDIKLDEKLEENFQKVGMAHIIVISGTHMSGFIYLIKLLKDKHIIKPRKYIFFKIIILTFFSLIVGSNISVFRAILSNTLNDIFEMFNIKKVDKHTKFFIILILFIIFNPFIIFNVSFILSFLCILAINLFYDKMYNCLNFVLSKKISLKNIYVLELLSKYILSTFSMYLSVQIILFPVQIYFFNKIYLVSILVSILIMWCINSLVIFGILAILCINVPVIDNVLFNFIYIILRFIILIVEYFAKFDKFSISFSRPNVYVIISYYLILIFIIIKKYLLVIIFDFYAKLLKKKIGIKEAICIKVRVNKIRVISILSLSSIIVCYYLYEINFSSYVIYFNVKQGNMCYIKSEKNNVVVDCGSTSENLAYNILNNYMQAKNISKIDLVCITHMHSDHMNALSKLVDEDKVKCIAFCIPREENEEYTVLIEQLQEKRVGVIYLSEYDEIKLGKIDIKAFNIPDYYEFSSSTIDVLNTYSTMYRLKINKNNLLFMGDSTIETEKYFLENLSSKTKEIFENITVYQIGHHGSKTSTSEEFIRNLDFDIALISSYKKVYSHPSDEVVDRIARYIDKKYIHITEKNKSLKINIK